MTRTKVGLFLSIAATVGVVLVLSQGAWAQAWSFGVISDTQDTLGTGTSSVSTNIIAAVNQQFIARGVDFVVQPGDLGDNGSVASLQARLNANADLTAAGIPFYGLRGNHEDNSAGQAFFQANYIPAASSSLSVEVAPDATSYAITYKGAKLVLLDILTADTAGAMDTATTWMNGVLGESDHGQAFVLQHKNLLGQNHKDNAFGGSNDANPTQQNNFFQTLASNNVRYDISGHDHMNHRSIVTSPDGNNQVQEIISASDSTKFYSASSGFSPRETTVSDQQGKIGYYVYTVDGPKVTGEYWATTKTTAGTSDGDIVANPVWTLQDRFGYSLNGKQFTIARGASYVGVSDHIAAGAGFRGTAMSMLGGTNTVTATAEGTRAEADDLNTGWAPKAPGLASDVLTLWGMQDGMASDQTDPFVLSMTFATSEILNSGNVYLAARDSGGNWVNATSGNIGGTSTFVFGAYDSSDGLGTYGVDPATNTAWAVVNHNSDFAVVPEPATLLVVAFGGLVTLARRRKH
jgi:hypothetical protein